jgi:hypothetical protein
LLCNLTTIDKTSDSAEPTLLGETHAVDVGVASPWSGRTTRPGDTKRGVSPDGNRSLREGCAYGIVGSPDYRLRQRQRRDFIRYANESYIMILLRSIAIWLIFITIESLNGTIRTLWLVPLLGDLRAHQISFVTGSLLILTIATIFVHWLNISNVSQSIGIGVLWMLLTVVFEVGLGRLALGYSWAQIAADYNLLKGRLMPLGLVLLVLAPLIATKIRDVSIDLPRRRA